MYINKPVRLNTQTTTQTKNNSCCFIEQKIELNTFKDQKEKICKEFKYTCNICKCCIKKEAYEIDNVRALSNGGTNETNNLQPLCKACHLVKTSNELEQGLSLRHI